MSNALALAHVTQSLALLIENNLRPEIDMAVTVEARRPPADPPQDPTITVFLYRVTPNESRRNDDLPTRAPDGRLVQRPAAATDLHFLICAYGEENELVAERLIGCVVRVLHEFPVLPRDVIAEAGERPHLARSDFGASEQRVRFTPTELDVDETSKLWGMLHQTPYALSVAYQASLVRIEGREEPAPAPPVTDRTVRVVPFGAPGGPPRRGGPETAVADRGAEGRGGPTSDRDGADRADRGGGQGADGGDDGDDGDDGSRADTAGHGGDQADPAPTGPGSRARKAGGGRATGTGSARKAAAKRPARGTTRKPAKPASSGGTTGRAATKRPPRSAGDDTAPPEPGGASGTDDGVGEG